MTKQAVADASGECFEAIIARDKVGRSPSAGSIVALRDGRLMWTWGGGGDPSTPLAPNFSADGRVLMLGRTPLGQLFRIYSPDGGETWQEAEPTGLAARIGPMTLERLPDSDDVLVVWNQMSAWETMQGLYRHRISCAISSDRGVTWHHHKTLSALDDADFIEPGPLQMELMGPISQPLDRARYHRAPGPLRLDHPYCTFHEGHAVIVYGYGVLGLRHIIEKTYGQSFEQVAKQFGFEPRPGNPNKMLGTNKIHVLPIEWFYR